MKTTISINLGGIAFTIDTDAYQELKTYLDALTHHFTHEEGGEEILGDIEARIAEEFARKRDTGIEVVSLSMVQEIITRMGRIEDLTGNTAPSVDTVTVEDPYFARTDKERLKGAKRLYRDPEHAMLAGVSSGLAAYFSIDPSIPRIIFILLTFFGGSGILIYLILWLVLPEADTPLKQSELRGESPTIKDIEKKFKEMFHAGKKKISEIDTHPATKTIIQGAHHMSTTTRTLAQHIFRIGLRIVGIFLTITSFLAMMIFTFLVPFILINSSAQYIDFPIFNILTIPVQYLLVFGIYFTLSIPAMFIFLIGLGALRSRNLIRPGLGFGLFGIWCIALLTVGAIIATGLLNLKYDQTSFRSISDYTNHFNERIR